MKNCCVFWSVNLKNWHYGALFWVRGVFCLFGLVVGDGGKIFWTGVGGGESGWVGLVHCLIMAIEIQPLKKKLKLKKLQFWDFFSKTCIIWSHIMHIPLYLYFFESIKVKTLNSSNGWLMMMANYILKISINVVCRYTS